MPATVVIVVASVAVVVIIRIQKVDEYFKKSFLDYDVWKQFVFALSLHFSDSFAALQSYLICKCIYKCMYDCVYIHMYEFKCGCVLVCVCIETQSWLTCWAVTFSIILAPILILILVVVAAVFGAFPLAFMKLTWNAVVTNEFRVICMRRINAFISTLLESYMRPSSHLSVSLSLSLSPSLTFSHHQPCDCVVEIKALIEFLSCL